MALTVLGFLLALVLPLIMYSAQTLRIAQRHQGLVSHIPEALQVDRVTSWIVMFYLFMCWVYVGVTLLR